jgi:purine-binding chemotaxis protein CheW
MTQFNRNTKSLKKPENITGKKYLTFALGNEVYAIDILHVQEIKGSKSELQITAINDVPPHIKGVIYLHDIIVPVVDLRVFYHLKPADHQESNVVMMVNVNKQVIGMMIDAVLDIVDLYPNDIKRSPEFLSIIHHSYIDGIGARNDELMMILNVDKLFSNAELQVTINTNTLIEQIK